MKIVQINTEEKKTIFKGIFYIQYRQNWELSPAPFRK